MNGAACVEWLRGAARRPSPFACPGPGVAHAPEGCRGSAADRLDLAPQELSATLRRRQWRNLGAAAGACPARPPSYPSRRRWRVAPPLPELRTWKRNRRRRRKTRLKAVCVWSTSDMERNRLLVCFFSATARTWQQQAGVQPEESGPSTEMMV